MSLSFWWIKDISMRNVVKEKIIFSRRIILKSAFIIYWLLGKKFSSKNKHPMKFRAIMATINNME
jgi:hypothetical protein